MQKLLSSHIKLSRNFKTFCEKIKFIYIIKDELKVTPNTEIKVDKKGTTIKYLKDNGKLNDNLTHYFLPRNYPESVKEGYYHFSKWSFLASVSFFVMNFISTQVLINSLDIRGTKSFFLNAGLSWVIKEGLGQIGAILFVGKIGNKFDRNIKQWRFISLGLWNFGMILDTFAMIYPHHFLLIASIGSICNRNY
jgi:hypothetical protein